MKIDNEMAELFNIDNIDTTDIRTILNKIQPFTIYDDFGQIYVPKNCKNAVLNKMSKEQNINAWSYKCNYLIEYIKEDFEKCLKIIEEDKDLFVGYRISNIDKTKFYLLENIEYRLFTLCDVLAQMYNEFFEIEKNIGKVNYSWFFKRKEFKNKISIKFNTKDLRQFMFKEIETISKYFESDIHYKYVAEKRNSFTHRENPHDCYILNGGKKKFVIDHPLYELNECIKVFEWTFLKICTIQKIFFFMLKDMGLLTEYSILKKEKME